ncbi:unnamed protein product [Candida verbasci]|uniref:ER membrane protein complex subunit 3 n=1 Tax=Candida verbasci TaxID=1227364 RepID=A0A9W4TZ71_9ASCO|nr:unnamed protein product [Candida verbasci]
MFTPDLLLDLQLKYWVLLPISLAMVLVGLLRSNITYLLQPNPKLQPYKQVRESQFLFKAKQFRENNDILTTEEFEMRKNYYIKTLKSDEFYASKPNVAKTDEFSPLDPTQNEALMSMAKSNLLNYIPQTLIMGWVNYFFAGFVIMKLPFALTDGFKAMLQNGIDTPNLNVRYVSSISWYFVNLFGLKPIYSLIMGNDEAEELIKQQNQNQMPQLSGPGQPKIDKIFNNEAENIQILTHESTFDKIIERFIEKYQ